MAVSEWHKRYGIQISSSWHGKWAAWLFERPAGSGELARTVEQGPWCATPDEALAALKNQPPKPVDPADASRVQVFGKERDEGTE